MSLKNVRINNFKSLVDFELNNLNQFSVFAGPNASGKSNIFEALEFSNYIFKYSFEASSFFGGSKSIYSFNPLKHVNGQGFYYEFTDGMIIDFHVSFFENGNDSTPISGITFKNRIYEDFEQLNPLYIRDLNKRAGFIAMLKNTSIKYDNDYEQFVDQFSRVFIGKSSMLRRLGSPPNAYSNLNSDASNLSQALGKIFDNKLKSNDFIEWLTILIPEFSNIEIKKSNIDGSYDFFLYEKNSTRPFPKYLISDGTYNIIALMSVIYQTDEPQFICIEEPENGLHPYAIQLLVDFFREQCETNGHSIWLNTHSQSLVRCLTLDELILVNKVNGETKAKQFAKEDWPDIQIDEAWLTNTLGGGVLWSR